MPKYKRTRLACYSAYFTMASVFGLPPVLLAPLHELYGISYTLLGTLVLVNFFTQMAVDLAFTLFGKRWRVDRILWLMPLITTAGLALYALLPMWFPDQVYAGLVIGTVAASPIAQTLSQSTGMTADQIGMKTGMLTCAVFPILGVIVLLILMRYFKKNKEQA